MFIIFLLVSNSNSFNSLFLEKGKGLSQEALNGSANESPIDDSDGKFFFSIRGQNRQSSIPFP